MHATLPKSAPQTAASPTPGELPGPETTAIPRKTSQPKLTQQQLEAHLWGAANILRGKTAGQDYKNYILSLMFYKRLCDQWECEADDAIAAQEKTQGRAFGTSRRLTAAANLSSPTKLSTPSSSISTSTTFPTKASPLTSSVAPTNISPSRENSELPPGQWRSCHESA